MSKLRAPKGWERVTRNIYRHSAAHQKTIQVERAIIPSAATCPFCGAPIPISTLAYHSAERWYCSLDCAYHGQCGWQQRLPLHEEY